MKKFFIYLLVGIFVSLFLVVFMIYSPSTLRVFDNKINDMMFAFRGEVKGSDQIVIVDIDEKSIASLGQWPWPRDSVARLIEKATQKGAGMIGLDIVFAEYDRTSPSNIVKKYNLPDSSMIEDYDEILANVVANTPVILGYQFELTQKPFLQKTPPNIPAVFIEKNKPEALPYRLIEAQGVILNNPLLQEAGYSSGFFNNIPDDGGITRGVPLLISYEDRLYPSLVLEMVRAANDIQKVIVNYNPLGIENIQLGDFYIPTDRYGRLLVNFRGKERSFRYISAIDILEDRISDGELEGKIVLVGTSAAGLLDLRATPFESVFPGVEIHANALDNIISGDSISAPYWVEVANIVTLCVVVFLSVLIVYLVSIWFLPIAFGILFFVIIAIHYQLLFTYMIAMSPSAGLLGLVVSFFVTLLVNYFYETKQKELIKGKLSSKVSYGVMEEILRSENSDIMDPKERVVSIFFSDIRGFTTISESMADPRKLINYLNRYLNPITEIIIKSGGTIDKYIGDAVMAYWNAPTDLKNHQDKAVGASLSQLLELRKLNKQFLLENLPPISIGIGINTGNVTVGEMGSTQRSDYTVIGDPVNLASRLESLCKVYGASLIISRYTQEGLCEEYILRKLDIVQVKGKSEPVEIFEVYDYKNDPILLGEISKERFVEICQEIEYFNQGIDLYREGRFEEALVIFEDIEVNFNPINTMICGMYSKRCYESMSDRSIDFDGIYTHTTK